MCQVVNFCFNKRKNLSLKNNKRLFVITSKFHILSFQKKDNLFLCIYNFKKFHLGWTFFYDLRASKFQIHLRQYPKACTAPPMTTSCEHGRAYIALRAQRRGTRLSGAVLTTLVVVIYGDGERRLARRSLQ